MRPDRVHLHVGQVFHLAIHARVRGRIAALDELVVPDVGTMQLEGDERSVTSSPAGTDIVETLTLEPTASGTWLFKGAYLDAIDARTGKPSRFASNPVQVVVDPASSPRIAGTWTTLQLLAWFALVVVALLGALAVLIALVRERRPRERERPKVTIPWSSVAAPLAPRTPRDEVRDALRAYRSGPTNGALALLRGALFDAAGTSTGATLRDALAANTDGSLRTALIAAERAAFGPANEHDAASTALVDATETWLG